MKKISQITELNIKISLLYDQDALSIEGKFKETDKGKMYAYAENVIRNYYYRVLGVSFKEN